MITLPDKPTRAERNNRLGRIPQTEHPSSQKTSAKECHTFPFPIDERFEKRWHIELDDTLKRIRRCAINEKPIIGKNARKKLTRLFASDPQKFEERWEEKINEYLTKIRSRAGGGVRLRDHNSSKVLPAFWIINEAMNTLAMISADAYQVYAKYTFDRLVSECVRLLGEQIMPILRRYKQQRWCA